MSNLFVGAVSLSLLGVACTKDDNEAKVHIPISPSELQNISQAIRTQYEAILATQVPGESLILRLEDQSAHLTITVQNNQIIMAQITPRNAYAYDPQMAPTPYLDLGGDGDLETYPIPNKTYSNMPLTYGNYLALLTRFSIPAEVLHDQDASPKKNHKKVPENNLSNTFIPPSPELFSRIAQ